jgi:hypothetical protein
MFLPGMRGTPAAKRMGDDMSSRLMGRTGETERELSATFRQSARGPLFLLGLILLAIPFFFWPTLPVPLERDEGEYAWAADVLGHGGLPYRDTFLQKPPGIILIYRGIFSTIGAGAVAIHAALAANYVLVAYLLYRLGRRVTGDRQGGLWAAFLFVLSLISPAYQAAVTGTEAFMILPLVAAMACLWTVAERGADGRVAAAGLLFGLAIFFKQVAVFHGVHIGLSFLILGRNWTQRIRWLAIFCVCGLVPYTAWAGWYAARGALAPFLDCLLWHNLEYISGGMEAHGWPRLVRELKQFALFDLVAWAGAAAAVGMMLCQRRWWLAWFVGGWLVAAAAGICSGGYYRGHYFIQGLPPLCLACAFALCALRRFSHAPAIAALAILAVWAWPRPWAFGKSPEQQSLERYHVPRFINAVRVGDWLRAMAAGSLYVLGSEPEIYHYSDASGVVRYVIANPLFGGFASSQARQLEVLEALRAQPPQYIVVAWPPETIPVFAGSDTFLLREVLTLLDEKYRLEAFTRPDAFGLYKASSPRWDRQAPTDLAIFSRREGSGKV